MLVKYGLEMTVVVRAMTLQPVSGHITGLQNKITYLEPRGICIYCKTSILINVKELCMLI
jgi:hypothetical protein